VDRGAAVDPSYGRLRRAGMELIGLCRGGRDGVAPWLAGIRSERARSARSPGFSGVGGTRRWVCGLGRGGLTLRRASERNLHGDAVLSALYLLPVFACWGNESSWENKIYQLPKCSRNSRVQQ
jgi:hypothetical protein